jgi:hypothetical protein
MRLIVANLDYETPGLPAEVARAVSEMGTLLSVFGRAGDLLWTPAPVDNPLTVSAATSSGVRLVSGPLPEADQVLAWAESAAVARARRGRATGGGTWMERLWTYAPPAPAVVAQVNHRRFAFELGPALAGSRWVTDATTFEPDHDAWVLKAPMAAAGRNQLRRRRRDVDDASRVRAARLLRAHDELLYEPWLDRVDDLGAVGLIDDASVELWPPHRLLADEHGVYRGIDITGGPTGADAAVLTATADRVAHALREAGYRGPFGIDAFRWRDAAGAVHLHPLCEINARLTFAHVAHALGRNLFPTSRTEAR